MATVTSRNPATGSVVAEQQVASADEVQAAVDRAAAAFPVWAGTPVEERGAVLRRFADLVERDAAALTELVVSEVGKRREEAAGEVEWTAISARWYADHPPSTVRRGDATVRLRPIGVVGAITPWNVPLVTPAWKWLPALVAGDTVVWKPSELAPGTAATAARLLRGAGLPEGVLEVVHGGAEVGRVLCLDRRVAGIHFTGSTAAGRAIAGLVADRFARCALEMGGSNVAVVFADADVARAARCIVAAATSINGQKCTATRRVLVEAPVAAELTEAIAESLRGLRPGDPADPAVTLGPLIHGDARRRADDVVAEAVTRGAQIVARSPGHLPDDVRPDAFFPATLVAGLADGDPLGVDELFAPVLTLSPFASVEQAWRAANATPYGLSAAVHTADAGIIRSAAERLETGVLNINRRGDAVDLEAPFAGVKDSGNGFPEGGEYVYGALTSTQASYGEPGSLTDVDRRGGTG